MTEVEQIAKTKGCSPINNIADFLGPSYSEMNNIPTVDLDMTKANEQNLKDIEIQGRAEAIYKAGNALSFMEQCCLKLHPGNDKHIITAYLLSFAATKVLNSKGLHINVTGEAGSGKSHVTSTVLKHIPAEKQIDGHFSDKYLFYKAADGGFEEGTVICMDDQNLSETANDILKAQTSEWNKPYTLRTVIDKKSRDMIIPARCPRWITKCDATGDEQTADRQLTLFANNSNEQKEIIRKQLDNEAMYPEKFIDDTNQKICRIIWGLMKPTYVVIPYCNRIKVDGDESNRNYGILLSLIMSAAVMSAPVKMKNESGYVIAAEEDFKVASKLMNPILAGFGGSQKYKLTPSQEKIKNYLLKKPSGVYPYQELINDLTMSSSAFSQAINGRKPDQSDGLLKIPGFHSGIGSYDCLKNEKQLSWNKELFERWDGSRAYVTLENDVVYKN